VVPRVIKAGFQAVAADLPVEEPDKGLADYASTVAGVAGKHPRLTLVAQGMAAFIAPMIAAIVDVELVILVAPMSPASGESAEQWMANTGQREAARRLRIEQGRDPAAPFSIEETYLHDMPDAVARQFTRHARKQALRPFQEPWPLPCWPRIPTTCIVGRHDRLFPLEFQRRIIAERLGLVPEVIDGGHLAALSVPAGLTRSILCVPVE
jgi:pimeloyl-ACP methyl ester carboxylesterase